MMVKNFEIWNFSSLFRFVDHFRSTSGFLFLLSVHFRFASGSLLKSIFVDITLIIRVNCWKIYWLKICRFLIGCQLSTFDSTSRSLLILFSNSHPQETLLRNEHMCGQKGWKNLSFYHQVAFICIFFILENK